MRSGICQVDATPPSQLRFRLLGEATLRIAGVDNNRVLPQKGLALLIYLAMNRGRSVSRSALADLLWGDRVDSQARQNLRQCILTLRRDLGPLLARVLIVDDQSLALAADGVEVDALQFGACAIAADSTERQRCIDLPGVRSSAISRPARKALTSGRSPRGRSWTRPQPAYSPSSRSSSKPPMMPDAPLRR